jgi:hypothetical protein
MGVLFRGLWDPETPLTGKVTGCCCLLYAVILALSIGEWGRPPVFVVAVISSKIVSTKRKAPTLIGASS